MALNAKENAGARALYDIYRFNTPLNEQTINAQSDGTLFALAEESDAERLDFLKQAAIRRDDKPAMADFVDAVHIVNSHR